MISAARHFVLLALGLAGALLLAVGTLNFIVDPIDYFGNNRIGVYVAAERETKSMMVRQYPHDALLIGNSRMGMIPVANLKGYRFFNGAMGGATPEETFYFIKHYATGIKLVILGVDLGQSDSVPEKGDIFAQATWTSALDNLLNSKTLEYTLRTVSEYLSGHTPSIRRDGSFDTTKWAEHTDRNDPGRMNWAVGELLRNNAIFAGLPPGQMNYFKKIAACLRERGISCTVVIPPIYGPVAEKMRTPPSSTTYQAWRKNLDLIFPSVIDLSFSEYCAASNFFKADPVHFKPEVGEKIMNEEVIPFAIKAAGGVSPAAPKEVHAPE